MIEKYTYRVSWYEPDEEFVATVAELPSLSWLDTTQEKALKGLKDLLNEVLNDMDPDEIPEPLSTRRYSGRFNVRVPESLHRELAIKAAEEHISLNRLISDRLARI